MENKKQSLKSLLDKEKETLRLKLGNDASKLYQDGIDELEKGGILSHVMKIGDMAPNFALNNALGEPVEFNEYLKKGKVVLTWYRGGWCPYCNLTLRQLQMELPNFKANGANLLTLTPELPDKSLSTSEKNNLKFEVLSDLGNQVARKYGIVFKLTDKLVENYSASFDMNSYNGDESYELPLAATYIINESGKIIYAFLDTDYRNRAEPSDITKILKQEQLK